MNKESPSTESTNKLCEAIGKLEAYSLQQIESLKSSTISKTISLVRSVLASHFDSKHKKHRHQRYPPDKHEVMSAVELINRNRLFIEKLKEGTPAEQELAEKFTHTIETYNESCDQRIQGCISNRERLAKFFSKDTQDEELPKIALPKRVTVQHHYPKHLLPKKRQQFASTMQTSVPISKQSAELFHMKAIALLERYGIASNPEARSFVKQSPIQTTWEESSSTCTLTQTLSLFPGQTIVVMGTSSLDPITKAISHLFPDTFCLSLESTQTGFPHPIQRAGWTVASQLVHEFPQRIDLLKKTADLLFRKNQAVLGLVPQGNLLKHAKELLVLKKKCFSMHTQELLNLHSTLTFTILEKTRADESVKILAQQFHELLCNHPQPFDCLADVSHLIREYFMVKPHQQLLDAIIKGKLTDFAHRNPEIRYAAAKACLDHTLTTAKNEIRCKKAETKLLNEQIKLDYIRSMGSIFGEASKNIFLQYLSEDLVFSPPTLSSFECQVQTAAYSHLKDFLDELSTPLEEEDAHHQKWMSQQLKSALLSDIALFQDNSPLNISEELSQYFQSRHISLSAI